MTKTEALVNAALRCQRYAKYICTTNLMAAATIPPACDRFYNNLLCMKQPIVDAINQCKNSPPTLIGTDLVELAFLMANSMDHQALFDLFIDRTHEQWSLIASSQDVAAVLKPTLAGFEELGADRIAEILRVVKDKEVDAEIQKKLLNLGRSLVKISLRYIHETKPANAPKSINVPAMAGLYGLVLAAPAGGK